MILKIASFKIIELRGTWVPQLVKCLAKCLDLRSQAWIVSSSPTVGSKLGEEPTLKKNNNNKSLS